MIQTFLSLVLPSQQTYLVRGLASASPATEAGALTVTIDGLHCLGASSSISSAVVLVPSTIPSVRDEAMNKTIRTHPQ